MNAKISRHNAAMEINQERRWSPLIFLPDRDDEAGYLSFLLFIIGGLTVICCALFPPWMLVVIAAYITGMLSLLSIWLALGCGSFARRLALALLPGLLIGLPIFAADGSPLLARWLGYGGLALVLPAVAMPCVILRSLGFHLVPLHIVK
jgi:hypothetical protein